jgi:hypothetical protein
VLGLSACSIPLGRSFPSPDPGAITVGTTDKAFLLRVFGDPYQVGLDSGNQTWKWFYGERGAKTESTKELNVIFNPDGTVKAFSFLSNFPQDMARMK